MPTAQERVLNSILRLTFDKKTADAANTGILITRANLEALEEATGEAQEGFVVIEDVLEKVTDRADEAAMAFADMSGGLELFERSAEGLSEIGRTLIEPMRDAAAEFVDYAGTADEVSRDWLDTTHDLHKAHVRIGRVAAQAVLPALETAADLAGKAVDFAEEYPGLIKAATGLAATTATMGAIGLAVTKGIKIYPDVKAAVMATKQFTAGIAMKWAAKEQEIAAVGMQTAATEILVGMAPLVAAAAAVAGGVGIGLAVVEKLSETEAGIRMGIQGLAETATVIAFLAGKLLGGEERGMEWAAQIGAATGAIDDLAASAYLASQEIESAGGIPQEALDAFIEHQREMAREQDEYNRDMAREEQRYQQEDGESEQDHNRRMAELNRQFKRDMVDAERQFGREQFLAIRDFGREEAREVVDHRREMVLSAKEFARDESLELDDYYRDRMERARDFGKETARMEEDHQREMRYMMEDHEGRVKSLIRSRDALGLKDESNSFEQERRRAEDEYGIEAGRRNEDYGQEMADMEANFAVQRELRLKEFERQQAIEEEQFKLEQQRSKDEFNLEQADAEEEFDYERQEEKRRFQTEQSDADEEFTYERGREAERRDFERDMENQMFEERKQVMEGELADRIREIDEDTRFLGERERSQRNMYYEAMVDDATVFAANLQNALRQGYYYTPGKQFGGYANYGTYKLGEAGTEFVIDAPTTRALESKLGGKLDQQALLAGASGSAGKKAGGTLVFSPVFEGMGEQDRGWYLQAAKQAAQMVIKEVWSD